MKPPPPKTCRAVLEAAVWIALCLALILVPMGLLLAGPTPRGGGFWWDFALALGYATLAMIGVQFWLTARFKRATAPFGIDIVYYFHRWFASIAMLFLLAHVAILFVLYRPTIGSLNPLDAPLPMTMGWVALLAFVALVASSIWRKGLGIEYDRWRRWHVALSVVGLAAAVVHVFGIGSYLEPPWKAAIWGGMALTWLGIVAWVRGVRPWRLTRHPYRVTEVRREAGRSWTLRLVPEHHPGVAYRPGQFAWLTLRASPWMMREHPFSFSSTPTRPGAIEFTIKELGNFTRTIGATRPGEIAYVDAPYGHFEIDRHPDAEGLVFVAGGVGIAPILSMLRALADRGDRRPILLFYGNRRWDRIVARDDLDTLAAGPLDFRIVHVLGEPPEDWAGERGFVTLEVMRRYLPADARRFDFFVCGPTPMIRLVERNIRALGVPYQRMHSEIFDLA
jgi:predicted ferric reductase